MDAKTKIGTFLAESCGRASNHPPPQQPTPPKSTTFYAAPKHAPSLLPLSQFTCVPRFVMQSFAKKLVPISFCLASHDATHFVIIYLDVFLTVHIIGLF